VGLRKADEHRPATLEVCQCAISHIGRGLALYEPGSTEKKMKVNKISIRSFEKMNDSITQENRTKDSCKLTNFASGFRKFSTL